MSKDTEIEKLVIPATGGCHRLGIEAKLYNKYINPSNATTNKGTAKYFKCEYKFVRMGSKGDYSDFNPTWISIEPTSGYTISGGGTNYIDFIAENSVNNAWSQVTNVMQSQYNPGTIDSNLALNYNGYELFSANCYVINYAGQYCFPYVYGNAIQNGKMIPSTYSNNLSYINVNSTYGGGPLNKFVNYKNDEIKSGYIKDDVGEPHHCKLLWEDAPELIDEGSIYYGTSESLNCSYDCIYFTVPRNSIREGNAVIAACDEDNNVIWSWHIWVTYRNVYSESNYINDEPGYIDYGGQSGSVRTMNCYLGWCDPEDKDYNGISDVKLRVRILNSNGELMTDAQGKYYEKIFDIEKEGGYEAANFGNAPTYQWGRKDPIIPPFHFNGRWSFKGVYPQNKVNIKSGSISYYQSIQNPNVVYYGSASAANTTGHVWCKNYYYNLWGAEGFFYGTNTSDNVSKFVFYGNTLSDSSPVIHKNIYDPCPVGYRVPTFTEARFSNGYLITKEDTNYKVSLSTLQDNIDVNYPYIPWLNPSVSSYNDSEGIRLHTCVPYIAIRTAKLSGWSGSIRFHITSGSINTSDVVGSYSFAYPIRPVEDLDIKDFKNIN